LPVGVLDDTLFVDFSNIPNGFFGKILQNLQDFPSFPATFASVSSTFQASISPEKNWQRESRPNVVQRPNSSGQNKDLPSEKANEVATRNRRFRLANRSQRHQEANKLWKVNKRLPAAKESAKSGLFSLRKMEKTLPSA